MNILEEFLGSPFGFKSNDLGTQRIVGRLFSSVFSVNYLSLLYCLHGYCECEQLPICNDILDTLQRGGDTAINSDS